MRTGGSSRWLREQSRRVRRVDHHYDHARNHVSYDQPDHRFSVYIDDRGHDTTSSYRPYGVPTIDLLRPTAKLSILREPAAIVPLLSHTRSAAPENPVATATTEEANLLSSIKTRVLFTRPSTGMATRPGVSAHREGGLPSDLCIMPTERIKGLKSRIVDCHRRLREHRRGLEAVMDLALIATWTAEVQAEGLRAERELIATQQSKPHVVTPAEVKACSRTSLEGC